MNGKPVIVGTISVAIVTALLWLTNTRFGAYIVLDLFGGSDEAGYTADPHLAPIELSEFVAASPTFTMPGEIDQASGIAYVESSDTFAIVTDQAELFEVSNDFETIHSMTQLVGGLLLFRQGSMEAVESLDDDRIAVTGETSSVDIRDLDSDGAVSSIPLSALPGEAEFSGIAYAPSTQEYYLASDDTFSILVMDENGQLIRELPLEADELAGRSLDEYQISGLEYSNDKLFAVTENYNTIFVIDPAIGITREIGVEMGGHISSIAVSGNLAYLTVDHNYFDERPPVLVVDLESGI